MDFCGFLVSCFACMVSRCQTFLPATFYKPSVALGRVSWFDCLDPFPHYAVSLSLSLSFCSTLSVSPSFTHLTIHPFTFPKDHLYQAIYMIMSDTLGLSSIWRTLSYRIEMFWFVANNCHSSVRKLQLTRTFSSHVAPEMHRVPDVMNRWSFYDLTLY